MDLSRFPFRALACYTPYKYRFDRVMSELKRVGLDAVPFWQIPDPFYEKMKPNMWLTKVTENPGHFSCSMNHYRMAKTALTLGADGYLGFEDDLSFLKDASEVERVVDALPADADVALFEWRCTERWAEGANMAEFEKRKPGDLWVRANGMGIYGCGMYYLSKRGLKWYVHCMERGARNLKFRPSDGYFYPKWYGDMNAYAAVVRPCFQDSYPDCSSRGGHPELVRQNYEFCNPPDWSKYNVRGS